MNKKYLLALAITAFPILSAFADEHSISFNKLWSYDHDAATPGRFSEIPAFDKKTNTLWIAGVSGVDVLDAATGNLDEHIDLTAYGIVNSVAIHNGLAAFAIEATIRTNPGSVMFYNTETRTPSTGVNSILVGALPDMLTFTPDGSKLLVANEATPSLYGLRIGTTVPRVYAAPLLDPTGSVSIINMATRTVTATADFRGVPTFGSDIRTNPGMDYEPEYIAVNKQGTKAYVSLQEANAMGVLDLTTNAFTHVIGLGVKDFSLPGNQIDPLNNTFIEFISPSVKGFYMPDGVATYQWHGDTYVVMANEGDFREDDGDRSAASTIGGLAPLNNLRISNTESSVGHLFAAGARSFSIRDKNGKIIYDSGDILDKKAAELLIYDDNRSRDKGVEPEGVSLLEIEGRTYAFVGLERTLKSAVAIFDITKPAKTQFVDMIVTDGDVAPEGLVSYQYRGEHYLAIANEVSNSTTLYNLQVNHVSHDD